MSSVPLVLPAPLRKSMARNNDSSFFLSSSSASSTVDREKCNVFDVSGDVGVVGRISTDSEKKPIVTLDFKGNMFSAAFLPTKTTMMVVALGSEKAKIESVMDYKLEILDYIESNWLASDEMQKLQDFSTEKGKKSADDYHKKDTHANQKHKQSYDFIDGDAGNDDSLVDLDDDNHDNNNDENQSSSKNTRQSNEKDRKKIRVLSSSQVAPSPSASTVRKPRRKSSSGVLKKIQK